MARIAIGTAVLLLLSGCGSGPITDDEAGEDTGSDTSAATDSTSDGDEATDDTETGSDTSTDDTSTDDTSTDDTGAVECPPREDVTARFRVMPSVALAATCSVVDATSDGVDLYTLTLDCEGSNIVISVDSTIQPKPEVGDSVEIDYRVEEVGLVPDRWLAIHRLDGPLTLALGAVAASRLDPPGTTLGEFFRDPTLTVADTQPCEPGMDICGEWIRLALDVSIERFGPANDPVFSQGSWYADFLAFGYAIAVEEATRRLAPVTCDDVPEEWFQLMVVWFSSD